MLKHKRTWAYRVFVINHLQSNFCKCFLNKYVYMIFFQYPIFQNITFVNNFVNGVFDGFESIHVLKNKNIKILSIFYYHTQNKLADYMTTFICKKFISKKSNVILNKCLTRWIIFEKNRIVMSHIHKWQGGGEKFFKACTRNTVRQCITLQNWNTKK